jgi:hypothetical protein
MGRKIEAITCPIDEHPCTKRKCKSTVSLRRPCVAGAEGLARKFEGDISLQRARNPRQKAPSILSSYRTHREMQSFAVEFGIDPDKLEDSVVQSSDVLRGMRFEAEHKRDSLWD